MAEDSTPPRESAPDTGTVQEEKDREAREAFGKKAQVAEDETGNETKVPPARFDFFIATLVMEAHIALGEMPHPSTGETKKNLSQARYLIDVLGVLQEKTAGNLTPEEDALLRNNLTALRTSYLRLA